VLRDIGFCDKGALAYRSGDATEVCDSDYEESAWYVSKSDFDIFKIINEIPA
jgi:hypothetical protein